MTVKKESRNELRCQLLRRTRELMGQIPLEALSDVEILQILTVLEIAVPRIDQEGRLLPVPDSVPGRRRMHVVKVDQ